MAKGKDVVLSPEEQQLKEIKDNKKAFRKEQKDYKKEVKRRAKELEKQEREVDEQIDGTNASVVVVTLFLIFIWLGILCLLVKMDVGGFGSNVLSPLLKDVPIVNMILPDASGSDTAGNKPYGGYSSIKDAVDEIASLEQQIELLKNSNASYSEQMEVLKAEVARLQTFEDNQVEFQRIKEQFYEEVVYAENGPGEEAYRKYFEELDPTTAEMLYKQVVIEETISAKTKDYISTFSGMDAAAAAKILSAMTDDLSLAADILSNLSPSTRAAIMAEMDPAMGARLTKIMNPGTQ